MNQWDNLTQVMKVPPQALEAEQAVIGGLMLDNNHYDDVIEIISTEDFYTHTHKIIFDAILGLALENSAIDLVTVRQYLDDSKQLDKIGGLDYLDQLVRNTPSTANIITYANIVKEASIRRSLIINANKVIDLSYQPDDKSIEQIVSESQSLIDDSFKSLDSVSTDNVHNIKTGLPDLINELESGEKHEYLIKTGISNVDAIVSGFDPGDVVIVGGRPSHGKSTFGLNVAENNCIYGDKKGLFFSLEMPEQQLLKRMVSRVAQVPLTRIRNNELFDTDFTKIGKTTGKIMKSNLFVDDSPSLNVHQISARAKRHQKKHGLDFICIDYLQLIDGPEDNANTRITNICNGLQRLAKDLEIVVIIISQLTRIKENRAPRPHDLRESGAIEQVADFILFVYDRSKNVNNLNKNIQLIVAKQRNGPLDVAWLRFDRPYCTLSNGIDEKEDLISEEDAASGFD